MNFENARPCWLRFHLAGAFKGLDVPECIHETGREIDREAALNGGRGVGN